MIEVGAVFQRNDYHRDNSTPNYYVIVTYIDDGYIYGRRPAFNGELVHESVSWKKEEFPHFFRRMYQ